MTATITDKLARQITPLPGEDQPAFAIRFHSVAKRSLPDTGQRQAAMMQAWASSGDKLAAQAAVDFPADKYTRREGVCEFKEHVAHNADGSQSHYSRDELAAMTRNMNRRVSDTGNYGSLIEGHTSDDPDAPQPAVLGHRGPYYLGQIGNDQPRWAIFSVEHHKREYAPRLAARPTRSAEVWRSPRIEDRILDPVAALGAETPRLDLGMVRYQRTGTVEINGQQIERYAAACMPGAASVAVPTDKYAEEGPDMALSPEDVQGIAGKCAEAIMDTPEWQFIQSIMQSGGGDADDSAGEVADDATGMDGPDAMAGDAGAGAGDELQSVEDTTDEYAAPSPEPVADAAPSPDQSPDQSPAAVAAPAPDTGGPVDDRVAALEAEVAALKAKLTGSQAEKYRREALAGLRAKGYQIDVDSQMEIVAEMSGEGFEKYARSLQTTAVRIPLADSPDVHDPPSEPTKREASIGSEPEMERYAKTAQSHAIKSRIPFAEALELAKAGKI